MQQVIDCGEARILDHVRGFDHLRGQRAVAQHGGDRVERRIGGLMQVAIERCRLPQRERAQHLAWIVPEGRGNLGEDDVPRLHTAG